MRCIRAALPASFVWSLRSTSTQHLLLATKSAIVAVSWTCTYFAVKHLPISISSPIRATGPLWIGFSAHSPFSGNAPARCRCSASRRPWRHLSGCPSPASARASIFAGTNGSRLAGGRHGAERRQLALRQIPHRPVRFLGRDRSGVVFDLSRPPFPAAGHRLEAALVAAPRISLALEHPAALGFALHWCRTSFIFGRCTIPRRSSHWWRSLRRCSMLVAFLAAACSSSAKKTRGRQKLPRRPRACSPASR